MLLAVAGVLATACTDRVDRSANAAPVTSSTASPVATAPPPTIAAVVAEIEAGRARWAARRPVSYAYETRGMIVSVIDGSVADAVYVRSGNPARLEAVRSVDALFDAAVLASNTVPLTVEVDPEWGYLRSYSGNRDNTWVEGGVHWFAPGVHRLATKDTMGPTLTEMRARWASAGLGEYRFTFSPRCFCAPESVVAHVVGGATTQSLWPYEEAPATVEGLLTLVERRLASSDVIVGAFRADLGVPVLIDVDQISGADDDEFRFTITDWHAT